MIDETEVYFLQSDRLRLRSIREEDATPRYLQWINTEEITNGLVAGKYPSSLGELKAYLQNVEADKSSVMMAINEKETNLHIGNIKLHGFDWVSRTCELGLMIGELTAHGKGYGVEVTQLVTGYAFRRLNMRKIWLTVYDDNLAAIRTYEKSGFREEGRLKEHIYINGGYHDKIFMGLFAKEEKNRD